MSRIYERNESLDYGKVQEFWQRRSRRISETGPLRASMFGDEEFARKRDAYEKQMVLPHLRLSSNSRVLDVGCGTGRWGHELASKVAAYLGTDSCGPFIEAARAQFGAAGLLSEAHRFQQLAAQEVSATTLAIRPPFDVVIVAGLMLFLNDEDVASLLGRLSQLTASDGLIYVREPIALEERLTLKEHFSEELDENYHAIYRTVAEYETFFGKTLKGFTLALASPLFPNELCNRKETAQHIFILRAGV